MPAISMFYGIIIYMYFYDNKKHKLPHIHVQYQEDEIILSIPDGDILEGNLKSNSLRLENEAFVVRFEFCRMENFIG